MIKEPKSIKRNKDLYQLDSHKTEGLPFAAYHIKIDRFIGRKIPMHWHKEISVCIVLEGSITAHINTLSQSRQIPLQKGQGVFINENVIHGFSTDVDDAEVIMVVFDLEIVSGGYNNIMSKRYLDPIRANEQMKFIALNNEADWHQETVKMIMEAYQCIKEEGFWFEFTVRELATKFIKSTMVNTLDFGDCVGEDCLVNDKILHEMMTYINTHYPDKITVEAIATHANTSTRDCYRRFKRHLSTTPTEFLKDVRMKKALELLEGSNSTVTEISHRVGFADSSYFTKLFRGLMDCTPTKYREGRG